MRVGAEEEAGEAGGSPELDEDPPVEVFGGLGRGWRGGGRDEGEADHRDGERDARRAECSRKSISSLAVGGNGERLPGPVFERQPGIGCEPDRGERQTDGDVGIESGEGGRSDGRLRAL
jgi:hypothetical protein